MDINDISLAMRKEGKNPHDWVQLAGYLRRNNIQITIDGEAL